MQQRILQLNDAQANHWKLRHKPRIHANCQSQVDQRPLKLAVVSRIEAIDIKGLNNMSCFLQITRVTFHYVRHIHL